MKFREYILDDGSSLIVEVADGERAEGVVKAARESKSLSEKIGDAIQFDHAIASAKKSVRAMKAAFEEAKADEVQVKFGLKAIGELGGNFVVAKTGVEANYEVTLKWIKKTSTPKRRTRKR